MTKQELIDLLEKMPHDFDVMVADGIGGHVHIIGAISHFDLQTLELVGKYAQILE